MTRHSEQRRPHWTPELVEAVRHASRTRILNDEQTFAVIAAVENWLRKRLRESGTCRGEGMALCECCYDARELDDKVRKLQSQNQAVRDVCADRYWLATVTEFSTGFVVLRSDILEALDS